MKECMRGFVARGEPPTPRAPARMAHASTSSPQPSRRGSRVSSTDDASLLADPNLGARIRAGQLPVEVAVQLLRSDDPIVAMAAADHPDLPQRAIDDVAASEDPVRRCVAATSSRASSETLRRLSEDADGRVRETVATNTGTPPDALSVLWQDPRLRSALLANHALPQDLLSDVACDDVSDAVLVGYLCWRATARLGMPDAAGFKRVNSQQRVSPRPGETLSAYASRAGFPGV
jgi:hypothetical protein